MSDLHDELIKEVTLAHETVDSVIDRVNSLTDAIDEWHTDVSNAHERTKEVLNDE